MIVPSKLPICIIDDDEDVLNLYRKILKPFNEIDVQYFTNPLEAIEEIEKGEIKCVITDISMNEMSGEEVVREIASLRQGIVTIVATSKSSLITAHSCFRAGAYSYILKPVKAIDLIRTIDSVLKHFDEWNNIFIEITKNKVA